MRQHLYPHASRACSTIIPLLPHRSQVFIDSNGNEYMGKQAYQAYRRCGSRGGGGGGVGGGGVRKRRFKGKGGKGKGGGSGFPFGVAKKGGKKGGGKGKKGGK